MFAAVDGPTLARDAAAFDDALTSDLSEEDVERIADANVERIRDRLGERLPDMAHAFDVEVVGRLYELFVLTGNDRDRRIGRAILTKLVAMIEEVRGNEGPGGAGHRGARPSQGLRTVPGSGRTRSQGAAR